ncbi:MAG: S41 family peptidase [Candidatus Eremiobacteraeota bacterium]|nr:S41 family peptidase [Candidatus Eremiobacteraeota bacterium]
MRLPFVFRIVCAVFPALALLFMLPADAAGRPSLAEPGVSPNGREIAFVSGGNIWTVNAAGGAAHLLVAGDDAKDRPLYSPDGTRIAFISARSGNGDIYVLSLKTGDVKRLTYSDGYDQLESWSRDGVWLYFSNASKNVQGERDIYRVRLSGGTPMKVIAQTYVTNFFAAAAPDNESIAFNTRGFASSQWWRKGHSHLDESEIWVRHGLGDRPTYERLTDGNAKEVWPMWAPDGKHVYYMSDRSGAQNIWERTIGGAARQLTHFTNGRAIWPTISNDGRTIVFERHFGIWRLDLDSDRAERVPIELRGEISAPQISHVTVTKHFSTYTVSPDGKKIAYIAQGQLFAASAATGGSGFKVTRAGEYATGMAWAPDSNTIAFTAGTGHEDRIYSYDFLNDSRKTLTTTPADVKYLTYAPMVRGEAQRLAFEQNARELRVLDAATGRVRTLATAAFPWTPNDPDRTFTWSPDAKWISYFVSDNRLFTNVWLVDAQAPAPKPISFLSNVFVNTVSWSPDGTFVLFDTTQRTEPAQIARVDLIPRTPVFREDQFKKLFTPNGDESSAAVTPSSATPGAAGEAKKTTHRAPPVRVDFAGIRDRLEYLPAGLDVQAQTISPDGQTVLINGVAADQPNLYLFSLKPGAQPQVARQITASPGFKSDAQWAPDGKRVYYLGENGEINTVSLENGKTETLPLAAEFDRNWNGEKVEAFTEAWSAIRDYYYDSHTNGADWAAIHATYEPQIEGAQNPAEMRRLLSLMVGELNGSHLGVSGPTPAQYTEGRLGLDFDRVTYERTGRLRVTNVVPNAPAAISGDIRPGDDLTAVDGVRVDGSENLDEALDNTVGKKVELTIERGGTARRVAVKPAEYTTVSNLRYRQWVDGNRAYVDKISGGRLGYVHMADMSAEALSQLYKDLDVQNFSKQGVVIDIRSNHGGFVNAYASDVFSRMPYLRMTPRGLATGAARTVLGQRALEKPTVLVTNEETLSDGEDFTQAYRQLHLGKVVGEPTAGWIVYTSAIRLVDGTNFRLPFIRVTTLDGQPMELHPRPVDVRVQRSIESNVDDQLKAAVRVLLESPR